MARSRTSKAIAGVGGVAALVAAGLFLLGKPLLRFDEAQMAVLQRPGTLQIFCLDVNQASSTLIITPSRRHAILIDAGDTGAGKKLIVPLLHHLRDVYGEGPEQIDLMVITHYDSDHIGGADEVLTRYPVEALYDHGDHDHWLAEKDTAAMRDYDAAGRGLVEAIPLDFDRTIDGVRIRCLASNGRTRFDLPGSPFGPDPEDDNPNSVALLIEFEGFELYVAGDQTGETEARLVEHLPDVDVYLMNHHGSSTHDSSSPAFLDALSAEVAIASNGKDANYRHPHVVPVNHLRERGTDVYLLNFNPSSEVCAPLTGPQFDAAFVSDDDPSGQDGTLAIVVDPTEGGFVVLVPDLPIDRGAYPIQRGPVTPDDPQGQLPLGGEPFWAIFGVDLEGDGVPAPFGVSTNLDDPEVALRNDVQ